MAKSGSRIPHFEIIDRPDMKSPLRHVVEGGVTASLWVTWLYMLVPALLTIILWVGGSSFFYWTVLSKEHLAELKMVMKNGSVVILLIALVHSGWIYYNYRFIYSKYRDRRKEREVLSDQVMARYFSIEPAKLVSARKHNRLEINWKDKSFFITKASTVLPANKAL